MLPLGKPLTQELDQTQNHIHTYIFWESEVYNTTPLPIYIGKILQLAD